ncbi:hypothetical protein JZ785_12725 [Alicyclobacillus curvatus]|nr:hypothetical protein JZ785_12725 [Alicyclobacillus curvatus]
MKRKSAWKFGVAMSILAGMIITGCGTHTSEHAQASSSSHGQNQTGSSAGTALSANSSNSQAGNTVYSSNNVSVGLAGSNTATTANPSTSSNSSSPGASISANVQGVMPQTSASRQLNAITFANPATGWMGGRGLILGTVDGGQDFQTLYQGSVDVKGLDALNTSSVWAWGIPIREEGMPTPPSHGVLLVSHDGGSSWNVMSVPLEGIVEKVDFVSSSVGYMVVGTSFMGAGQLYRTSDGGTHWTRCTTPAAVTTIGFANAKDGWLYAENGIVYHTANGAQTWVKSLANLPRQIGQGSLQVSGTNSAWLMVYGQAGMSQQSYSVFHTTDGTTWHPVMAVSTAGAGPAPGGAAGAPKGPGSSPGAMAVVNNDTAVVAGTCRACGYGTTTIAATTDGGQSWSGTGPIAGATGLPQRHAMAFPTASDGWLLDGQPNASVVLHTTDGGKSWREVFPTSSPYPLQGLSFISPSVGYGLGVVGNLNEVLKTTDGGELWTPISQLPVQNPMTYLGGSSFSTISFVTASTGFAVGTDGHVYQTVNSGRSWAAVNLPYGQYGFDAVYFSGRDTGVALSIVNPQQDQITTDGGRVWTASNAADTADAVTAIANGQLQPALHTMVTSESAQWAGVLGDIAWVPAQNGRGFYLTTDSGLAWSSYDYGTNGWDGATTMQFINGQDGWLIQPSGLLLRTQNGGQTWILLN